MSLNFKRGQTSNHFFLKGINGSLKKDDVLSENTCIVSLRLCIMFSVHLDLQCPDCLMAWDALKQMADHYERSAKLSIVDFPLPYHRAAFKGEYQSQALTY